MFKYFKEVIMAICIASAVSCAATVKTGLDNIESYRSMFKNKRLGIITNHTAYDSSGKFIVDIFREMDDVTITAVFGPEHGLEGLVEDAIEIDDNNESALGLPVYSLYGKNLKPTEDLLKNIDVLIFDIQDIGARFYTYISTMSLAMEAAAEQNIKFVVLDRPNPVNAVTVEGNILDRKFATFVGLHPIATRHGMTVGELAVMFNRHGWLKDSINADLTVVPMANYKRHYWFDQTGLTFIKPSPNMTSIKTAAVYPGTCLLEGTNISEGRGTEIPFLQFGAPWIDSKIMTDKLNELKLPGLRFEPTQFNPTFSKFENQKCFGSKIVIMDRDKIDTFWTGVLIIDTIYHLYHDKFEWRQRHFDRLCGTDNVRISITEHKPLKVLQAKWQIDIEEFLEIREKYLLY